MGPLGLKIRFFSVSFTVLICIQALWPSGKINPEIPQFAKLMMPGQPHRLPDYADEGVIKFYLHWKEGPILDSPLFEPLIRWRDHFHELGLIGFDKKMNVGFGNISIRIPLTGQFYISGTQTGHLPLTGTEHYCLVEKFDLEKNLVTCKGPVKASSESLTHAVLYNLSEEINGVIHIHNPKIWKTLWDKVPATAESVPYGSIDMAREVVKLFHREKLEEKKIFIMKGHQDGIVAFGATLADAAEVLKPWMEATSH